MPKSTVVIVVAIVVVAGLRWSPMDYFVDAGRPAYYQARVAYMRGNESQRNQITATFQDRKISLHDYSATIFPAFLKSEHDHEVLFAVDEGAKSIGELRDNLAHEISGS